jgi:hypothetical protein
MTTVAMLPGQTWTAAVDQITPAGLSSLDARRGLALEQLSSARHQAGRKPSGHPCTPARLEPW